MIDVPVVLVMPVPQVRVVRKTVEELQFEIVEKTVENPETQIDTCLTCDAKCMVACETCVKDNMFMVAGEITVAGKTEDCDELVPEMLNFVRCCRLGGFFRLFSRERHCSRTRFFVSSRKLL